MSNRSKTLYTGVTNSLDRRVWEHKNGQGGYFTSKYKIGLLVHYEVFSEITHSIAREKQIKGLLRIKKMQLIVADNPGWADLSADWGHPAPMRLQGKHRSFTRR